MNAATSDTTLQRISQLTRTSPFLASLRTRLAILVLLAILPALGLIIYGAVEQQRRSVAEAQQAALRIVRMVATQHDHLVESTRQLLTTLALLSEVQERNQAPCQEIFTNLLALHPVYANIGACDLQGNVFASALPLTEPVNLADRTYFQLATNNRAFAIGDYIVGRISRKASLNMAYPVIDRQGQLRAIAYAALDLGWLHTVITNVNLPPNSSMTVFDQNGLTLARYPDDRFVGQSLRPRQPRRPGQTPTNPPPRQPEGFIRGRSRDGTMRLYAWTRLGHSQTNAASITVGIPVSVAYSSANQTLARNLAFLGVVALLGLVAAHYGANLMVLRRVDALVLTTERLRSGNLQARTNVRYGRGELGQLARAFDEMAEALEQRVTERERARAQLQALNEDLEARVAERTVELRRSNEDLEAFAYVASHDLQEPLRMVTTYLQLLQQRYADKLDPKANEFIGFAVDGAARMQKMIKDLLTYSRVGSRSQNLEPTDCQQVLEAALSNLKLAIQETGASITRDPLPTVVGDPFLLSQLFLNLISNALKFRREAPPAIHVGVTRHEHEWLFSVRDNGIGIESKNFDRIFIIFQRLHAREAYPGTGVGLSVCKKIVERHGGRIWVESVVGQGSTFFFTLPLSRAELAASEKAA